MVFIMWKNVYNRGSSDFAEGRNRLTRWKMNDRGAHRRRAIRIDFCMSENTVEKPCQRTIMIREIDLRKDKAVESNDVVRLTVFGTRGSMPVSGTEFAEYGCATSCYLFEAGGEAIILDAGNGILNLPDLNGKRLSLILSHSHLDHILGLPMFLGALRGKELTVYGAVHEGLTIRQQLDELLKRPLWPIRIDDYAAKVRFVEIEEGQSGEENSHCGSRFQIGDVTVSAMASNHPGESTVIGLEYKGRKVVYATDFEHMELGKKAAEREDAKHPETDGLPDDLTQALLELAEFSKGADLILFDGQYIPEEYESHKGFGHSTYEQGISVKERSGIRCVRIIHHEPGHSDEFLRNIDKRLDKVNHDIALAREGDRYIL